MPRDVGMSFMVPEELRNAFQASVATQDRNASQVLRELMREFVKQNPAPKISEAERAMREDGDAFAVGNIGLEGFKVADEHEEIFRRYTSGEIGLDELDALVDAAAQSLVDDKS